MEIRTLSLSPGSWIQKSKNSFKSQRLDDITVSSNLRMGGLENYEMRLAGAKNRACKRFIFRPGGAFRTNNTAVIGKNGKVETRYTLDENELKAPPKHS